MAKINLPDDTQRLAIVGRTGSGKTQAGIFHLSRRAFDVMPWIIVDWKRDKLIAELGAIEFDITSDPPTAPGLYVTRPLPDDDELVDAMLRQVWLNQHTGIYIDEGLMMGRKMRWFRACLTQGRSMHIPMIILSQRPVEMDLFVFTEADYIQTFALGFSKDKKRVAEYTNEEELNYSKLKKYQSFYYDVSEAKMLQLGPVPSKDTLIHAIRSKASRITRAA